MLKESAYLKLFSIKSLFFIEIVFFIAIDQLFKYKIRHFGGFYICNRGISFGIFVKPVLFWFILAIFLFLLFFYLHHLIKNGLISVLLLLSLSLIMGGALSNALDRIFLGCILDYIYPVWVDLPVFNLADIFIFMGGILFFILILFKNNPKR